MKIITNRESMKDVVSANTREIHFAFRPSLDDLMQVIKLAAGALRKIELSPTTKISKVALRFVESFGVGIEYKSRQGLRNLKRSDDEKEDC